MKTDLGIIVPANMRLALSYMQKSHMHFSHIDWGLVMRKRLKGLLVLAVIVVGGCGSSGGGDDSARTSGQHSPAMGDGGGSKDSNGWNFARLVDRMTDEQGVIATGTVDGIKVTVRCMAGNSLAYGFELPDRTDNVGIFWRSAAVQMRFDDASPELTTVQTDQRFPNQIRFATKGVSDDLDSLADAKAWNRSVDPDYLSAVQMALADRVRLAIRTDNGETFIDLHQSGAMREVHSDCSATPEEFQRRLQAKLAKRHEAEVLVQQTEVLRSQLANCIEASGEPGSGSTPQIGFDVHPGGPANINADFGDEDRVTSNLLKCWPSQIPDKLVGQRVMMRLPD